MILWLRPRLISSNLFGYPRARGFFEYFLRVGKDAVQGGYMTDLPGRAILDLKVYVHGSVCYTIRHLHFTPFIKVSDVFPAFLIRISLFAYFYVPLFRPLLSAHLEIKIRYEAVYDQVRRGGLVQGSGRVGFQIPLQQRL